MQPRPMASAEPHERVRRAGSQLLGEVRVVETWTGRHLDLQCQHEHRPPGSSQDRRTQSSVPEHRPAPGVVTWMTNGAGPQTGRPAPARTVAGAPPRPLGAPLITSADEKFLLAAIEL